MKENEIAQIAREQKVFLSYSLLRMGRDLCAESATGRAMSLESIDNVRRMAEVYALTRSHVAIIAVAWTLMHDAETSEGVISSRKVLIGAFGEERAMAHLHLMGELIERGVFVSSDESRTSIMHKRVAFAHDFELAVQEADTTGTMPPAIVFETNEQYTRAFVALGGLYDDELTVGSFDGQKSTMVQFMSRESRSADFPFKLHLASVAATIEERVALAHLAHTESAHLHLSVEDLYRNMGDFDRWVEPQRQPQVHETLIQKGLAKIVTDQRLKQRKTPLVLTDIVRELLLLDDPNNPINSLMGLLGDSTHFTIVTPEQGLSELIVEPNVRDHLITGIDRFRRNTGKLLAEWGVRLPGYTQQLKDRLIILLYGPPGTGKTMAAYALARELGKEALTIDPSSFLGSFVGESEKSLREVFRRFSFISNRMKNPPVLVMNEADAILHPRGKAHHSTDHMQNNLVSILLEELERCEGLIVLTVNDATRMDEAFSRRIDLKILIDRPTPDLREKLWRLYLPPTIPGIEDIDPVPLAQRYELTGGQIRMIVANACSEAILRPESDRRLLQSDLKRYIDLERTGQFELHTKPGPMGFVTY